MKTRRGAVCLVSAALIFCGLTAAHAQQRPPEVRRAQPVKNRLWQKQFLSIRPGPLLRRDRAALLRN